MLLSDTGKHITTMESEIYKGYAIYGHSIEREPGFGASGTVMRDGRVVQSSGILEIYVTDEEALLAGLAWAREWIDSQG